MTNPVSLAAEVLAASRRIRPYIRQTPAELSPALSERVGAEVHLKLENLQLTGSFKLRGAMNKLLSLSEAERQKGVVAASSGNHGAAVAHGARALGVGAMVFVPEGTAAGKRRAIERLGAEVRVVGRDCVLTEAAARRHAEATGTTYVSPYNDPAVVAGQGTLAVELQRQVPDLDAVFVALGGGGLVSGIAAFMKSVRPAMEVIACSPESSPVMEASVAAGRILEMDCAPTLSDSTAGGVEPGAITFDLCRDLVDRYVRVGEEEIGAALADFVEDHHQLIEGAAAVAVAGLLGRPELWRGRRVAVVICGANISRAQLRSVL